MSEREAVEELRALDAVAAEQGALLAFRVAEEGEHFEPVFMRVMAARVGEPGETALVSIEDRSGLPLGRYVIPRARLEQALTEAEDVDAAPESPSVVPADWDPPARAQ